MGISRDGGGGGDANDIGVRIAQQVQPSMALVTPKGVRNMTSRGSGFVVDFNEQEDDPSTTYVLTAAHVALPGYQISCQLEGAEGLRQYPASIVGRNATLDLALLRLETDSKSFPSLKLSDKLPATGENTFAFGFPASRLRGPAMTSGIVCGLADGLGRPEDDSVSAIKNLTKNEQEDDNVFLCNAGDDTLFVVTDAAFSSGMSGGPLVNVQGQVIGVNALIRPDLRALGNYAVSAAEAKKFLDQLLARQQQQAQLSKRSDGENQRARYRLWLFNDRMNKKERVSEILQRVANLTEADANTCMMAAHTRGRGAIGNYTFLNAQVMCDSLRNEDILVYLEEDPIVVDST
jgi:S1-C subfamily serine protease